MTERTPSDEPRAQGDREWELFARTEETDPLRHVGSVSAPTAEVGHEVASRLVPDAHAVWLCPADEVARFDGRSLADRGATPEPEREAEAETNGGTGGGR
jgi:rSAM-partnered protein